MSTLPEPRIDAESAPFYEAAAEGRFLIRRCTQCREPHWYPRSLCPFCFSPTAWEEASGRGEVLSYTIMRKAEEPYVLAYVKLAEGPAMLTNVVGCADEDLAIGMPVEIEWTDAGKAKVPCFRPATPDRPAP